MRGCFWFDQIVRRNKDGSVFDDKWVDEVSVLSMQIWDSSIYSGSGDVELSHSDTEGLCLLYSAGSGVWRTEPWQLDWKTRAWIIGDEPSGLTMLTRML